MTRRRHSSVLCHPLDHELQIKQFLCSPSPREQHDSKMKASGRVLTSAESMKALKEKERQKELKAKAKHERELKRLERCEGRKQSQAAPSKQTLKKAPKKQNSNHCTYT